MTDQQTWNTLADEIRALKAENDRLKRIKEPCRFCDHKPDLLAETEIREVCIEHDNTLYVRGFEDYGKCRINFCPMCGREL